MTPISRDDTERKLAEEALRLSQERLSRAQQIAHIGDWEWEIATNKVHWSDELYRIYGYEPREIAPDYGLVINAMHPKSKDEFFCAVDAALKGEKPFELDYTFFRKDGSGAILHTIGKVIYDRSGNPERMVGTVQDITEQKRAEETVRESEEKCRNIFDKANDGILIANVSTRKFFEANRTICDMLGYSREEIMNLSISDIHPAEDMLRVMAEFQMQMRGEKAVAEDLPVVRKDGSVFYADIGTTTISLGGELYAIGIFRDITERKKMEEALRKSHEFIESVLDTVDEAFIIIDTDYRIILANRAFSAQTGIPIQEIIGKHCYTISHRSDRLCYEMGEDCAVRHCFEKGEPHTCIHKHHSGDGGLIYAETKSYPLKDAAGNVQSCIEVIKNITDKHLLEEQLLRTQKLEAVGLLASGIAHDFNNLLQSLLGSISLAKMFSDKGGKSHQVLEEAEDALIQATNLTKQLLTFSKGGEPLKRLVSLPPILRDSVKFALSGSRSNAVFEIVDDLWHVEADEGQISQVIHNIVLNARDAMPEGGTVSVETRNMVVDDKSGVSLASGKYVLIAIKDSGMGIPAQDIPRIFDPYFTTKERGSGLGLATSYSIVKRHGGVVDVQSTPGAGSTFFIYLPASGDRAPDETVRTTSIEKGTGRILVMDDEEIIRTVVGRMLRSLGYEVAFAENGDQATIKYAAAMNSDFPFDAVILDLTVRGGMGGREAISRLRAIDPHIRAVVSSGYSEGSILSDYSRYGFKAVLPKPYNIETLGKTLKTLMRTDSA